MLHCPRTLPYIRLPLLPTTSVRPFLRLHWSATSARMAADTVGNGHLNGSAEAGPSSAPHIAKAYPETRFHTKILSTDVDSPITFSSTSSSDHREPLHKAHVQFCTASTRTSLSLASSAIRSSLPVAFPTETVYGLAANALDSHACKAIFDAKGRPQDNPLIVHVSDLDMARSVTQKGWAAPRCYSSLMKAFWPGGITFLVPAARSHTGQQPAASTSVDASAFFVGTGTSHLPMMVTANHPLVGIRMPSHPLARALIAETQLPLAAPSANASGRPSPTTAQHVMYDLGGRLDSQEQGRIPYILDGGSCENGVESTVVDGVTESGQLRILRPGAVSPEDIQRCLHEAGQTDIELRVYGKDLARQQAFEAAPTTPGMKYRHYSPTSPVVLLVPERTDGEVSSWRNVMGDQVTELRAARGGAEPITIGVMLLVDSPLAQHVFQEINDDQIHQWLDSERKRTNCISSPSPSQRLTHEEEKAEMKAALGPRFSFKDSDDDDQGATSIQPFSLGTLSTPALAARRLFAGLRILDEGSESTASHRNGVDLILIESVADTGIGLAVMNRVVKAAGDVVRVAV